LQRQSEGLLSSPNGLYNLAKNLKRKQTLAPEAAKRACSRDETNISWNFSMPQKEEILSNNQGV